jgi:hypothetical protein
MGKKVKNKPGSNKRRQQDKKRRLRQERIKAANRNAENFEPDYSSLSDRVFTLEARAKNAEPTWVEVTPETVTAPDDLKALYGRYFNHEMERIYEVPGDTEQVQPVLDLCKKHDRGNTPVDMLRWFDELPDVDIITARYKYAKENQDGNVFTGEYLTTQEVAERAGMSIAEVEEAAKNNTLFKGRGGKKSRNGNDGYYAAQFNPDGSINPYVSELIKHTTGTFRAFKDAYTSMYSDKLKLTFTDLFIPCIGLGYVTPIQYVALGEEYLDAYLYAHIGCLDYMGFEEANEALALRYQMEAGLGVTDLYEFMEHQCPYCNPDGEHDH